MRWSCKILGRRLSCEVTDDPLICRYYSADAGPHTVKPGAIVFPKNDTDVQDVVRFACRYGVPVTARGAGTGLVGGALGGGIIVDFKNMDRIDVCNDIITAQPGAPKGVLDDMLHDKGRFFSPNPSVGRYCSLGGMIGTNASGSHALKYGSLIDNLTSVTVIDGRGRKITLPDCNDVAEKIAKMSDRIDRSRCPDTTKNSCGYRLDAVRGRSQAHKVIAGSEGTLGLVVSATFRTQKIPKSRILAVFSYLKTEHLHHDVNYIMKQGPAALEYMDRNTMNCMTHDFGDARHALFVEFDSHPRKKISMLEDKTSGRAEKILTDDHNIQKWWQYRNSALSYAIRKLGNAEPQIMEDAAVPIASFGGMLNAICSTGKRYRADMMVYGHAGNANLHARLKSRGGRTPRRAYDEFFGKIWKMKGTITAEHGDGISRTRFVRRQYGEKNHGIFVELKEMMDPAYILNPDKIVRCSAKRPQA